MKMEMNITAVMIIVVMNDDRLTIGFVVMLMLLFRLINIFMNSIRWSSLVFMMVIMPMMVVIMMMTVVVMIMVVRVMMVVLM